MPMRLSLFVPQIWPRAGYTVPDEIATEIDQEIGTFLQNPGRDALGVIDDDTYFESLEYHHQRLADVAAHLTQRREWDVLMVETHAPDYTSHFFLSQADEISGAPPETIQRCREGVIRTYASVDRMIGRVMELADDDTVIFVCVRSRRHTEPVPFGKYHPSAGRGWLYRLQGGDTRDRLVEDPCGGCWLGACLHQPQGP